MVRNSKLELLAMWDGQELCIAAQANERSVRSINTSGIYQIA